MSKYKVNKTIEVEITPDELGRFFAEMTDREQAFFFNQIAREFAVRTSSASWGNQLEAVRSCGMLDEGGKIVVRKMADYFTDPIE